MTPWAPWQPQPPPIVPAPSGASFPHTGSGDPDPPGLSYAAAAAPITPEMGPARPIHPDPIIARLDGLDARLDLVLTRLASLSLANEIYTSAILDDISHHGHADRQILAQALQLLAVLVHNGQAQVATHSHHGQAVAHSHHGQAEGHTAAHRHGQAQAPPWAVPHRHGQAERHTAAPHHGQTQSNAAVHQQAQATWPTTHSHEQREACMAAAARARQAILAMGRQAPQPGSSLHAAHQDAMGTRLAMGCQAAAPNDDTRDEDNFDDGEFAWEDVAAEAAETEEAERKKKRARLQPEETEPEQAPKDE